MEIVEQDEYKKAVETLKNGGIIAFPTETVYGLGVIFDNENSYNRLVSVKRRPPEKPFTLMLADPNDISKYAYVSDKAKKLIEKYVPGQFTLILKAKEILPSWCVSKEGNVGLRVPDMDFVRKMIRDVGKPLLVPSANKSGESPALSGSEVSSIFNDELDIIIDGESKGTIPSTVVLLENDEIIVLREGNIKKEDIINVVEDK